MKKIKNGKDEFTCGYIQVCDLFAITIRQESIPGNIYMDIRSLFKKFEVNQISLFNYVKIDDPGFLRELQNKKWIVTEDEYQFMAEETRKEYWINYYNELKNCYNHLSEKTNRSTRTIQNQKKEILNDALYFAKLFKESNEDIQKQYPQTNRRIIKSEKAKLVLDLLWQKYNDLMMIEEEKKTVLVGATAKELSVAKEVMIPVGLHLDIMNSYPKKKMKTLF